MTVQCHSRTAVLLMPSLWQESFGLVAVEAYDLGKL